MSITSNLGADSSPVTISKHLSSTLPGLIWSRRDWPQTAVIYGEGNFGSMDGKTANGLVRHSETYEILSVIDSEMSGLDAGDVLGEEVSGIPICRDLADPLVYARGVPHYFIIGLAPTSGRLSREQRGVVLDALDRGMHSMTSPRLEIDQSEFYHNDRTIVARLSVRKIEVMGLNEAKLGQAIDGIYTDAITFTAEVIESKMKPSQPWGQIAQ